MNHQQQKITTPQISDQVNDYEAYQLTLIAIHLAFEEEIPDQIIEDFVIAEAERLICLSARRGVYLTPAEAFRSIIALAGERKLTYDGLAIAVLAPTWATRWQRFKELIRAFIEWLKDS